MTATTETEVKFYVTNHKAIQSRLTALEATLLHPRVYERNVRYENAAETLTAQGIVVRLREDSRVRLTYKSPGTVRDGIISRFEAEVDVSDFATMEVILGKLGYHPYMIYEKYRTTYILADTEIVLDEMPFGHFVEIEGRPAAIEATIVQLQLTDTTRLPASYARLFENVRHHLKLDMQDLTFANFEGVAVPFSAFRPIEL